MDIASVQPFAGAWTPLLVANRSSPFDWRCLRGCIANGSAPLTEHVLRDVSNASEPIFRRSHQRSSSIVTNPYEDVHVEDIPIRPKTRIRSGVYSRTSPTPSIKRNKVEKLIKEHGSPPGIRVTAGGRIVPHGASPVPSPRFLQNAPFKYQSFNRFGRPAPYHASANGGLKMLNGYVIDLGNGTLCQLIDGQLRPVEQHDGILHLYMPAPNLPFQPAATPFNLYGNQQTYPVFPQSAQLPFGSYQDLPATQEQVSSNHNQASVAKELSAMETVHAKLEQELKDLDRSEVLQRDMLTPASRAEIVRHRIELVNRIDESRRGIVEAKRLLNEPPSVREPNTEAPPNIALGVFGASQIPFPSTSAVDTYYNTGQHQVSAPSFGQGAFALVPYHASVQAFQPQDHAFAALEGAAFPTFMPGQEIDSMGPPPLVLQGRAGNVALAHDISAVREAHESADTAKISYPSNLDGSVHQSRRSHAVEIKKPHDSFEKTGTKSSLNPTSPIYQPGQMLESSAKPLDDEKSIFVPSPTLVAQMDSLVQSPKNPERSLDGLKPGHHSSDDSATTADFFPLNAKQHSSTKYSWSARDRNMNLPAWLAQAPSDGPATMTLPLGTNKSIWAASSDHVDTKTPQIEEQTMIAARASSPGPSANASPYHVDHSCDMDFITESEFTHISPATKRHQSAHLRESTVTAEESNNVALQDEADNVSALLQKVSQHVPSTKLEASASSTYWQGFETGMLQAVIGDNVSEEYRQGYRDGIINSANAMTSRGYRSDIACSEPVEWKQPTPDPHTSSNEDIYWEPSRLKSGTLRPYILPGVPQNSVANTPMTSRSSNERSPITRLSLNSPQAQVDFMSQPNINVSLRATPVRLLGTETSASLNHERTAEPPSPLADRQTTKAMANVAASRALAGKMQNRNTPLDQQRYGKTSSSMAPPKDVIHAHPQGQVDGLDEEIKKGEGMVSKSGKTMPPMSPPMSPRSKGLSPVKSAATAAVASIAQLARSGTRKEQDAARPMSLSPEKRAWRSKWIGGRKVDEENERK